MSTPASSIPPAVINHVVKGLIQTGLAGFLGFLAIQFAFLDERMQEQGVQLGFGAGFGVVALCFALAGCRNVHALIRPPCLLLSPEGVKLRCWLGVGFTGFFLPYYRVREYWIPWADFGQTQTFTYRVNGVPTVQELRIQTTTHGQVAFGWDVFSPNVARIQGSILDYIDERFRGPKRASARLPDFQRLRWHQPLLLKFSVVQLWWAVPGLAVGAPLWWWGETSPGKSDWVAFAGFAGVFIGVVLAYMGWQGRRNAVVELRSDGLALGPSQNAMKVIPWAEIQLVRPLTTASTTAGGAPVFDGLEMRKQDGSYFHFKGLNGAEYERLHALLEPPLDGVIAAHERIARGEAPEAAAVAAGLAPR